MPSRSRDLGYDRGHRAHLACLGVGCLLFPERHLLFDIELLDHLIIGQGRWLSLKRLRLGFPKT